MGYEYTVWWRNAGHGLARCRAMSRDKEGGGRRQTSAALKVPSLAVCPKQRCLRGALVFFGVKSYLSLIGFHICAISLCLVFKNHLKLCMRERESVCVCFLAFNLSNLRFLNTNFLSDSDKSALLKQPQQASPVCGKPTMWLSL